MSNNNFRILKAAQDGSVDVCLFLVFNVLISRIWFSEPNWFRAFKADEITKGVLLLKNKSVDQAQLIRELYMALAQCLCLPSRSPSS